MSEPLEKELRMSTGINLWRWITLKCLSSTCCQTINKELMYSSLVLRRPKEIPGELPGTFVYHCQLSSAVVDCRYLLWILYIIPTFVTCPLPSALGPRQRSSSLVGKKTNKAKKGNLKMHAHREVNHTLKTDNLHYCRWIKEFLTDRCKQWQTFIVNILNLFFKCK